MRRQEPGPVPYALKRFKYNSHYWVLKFLSAAERPLRILEVGTADGYLGAILKNSGHSLVGVEQDIPAAEQARAYYDCFHVADIESFEFPYLEEFDFILFADVLEHVRDPIRVLQRSLPTLKKTGELIISLPNVANIVIRLSLLVGRFDYCERGILDRTHLRFFTLSGLKLDVATSSLDSEFERLVQEALERLMVERSALVIAHRFSTIRKANRIIVLVDRTIAEEGIHDELLEPKTEYHTLPAGSLALKKLALVLVRAFSFAFALPRLSSLGVFLWAILSSWTYQNVLYIGATSWT